MTGLIRIGTRGSKLALVQAERVKNVLRERFTGLKIETVVIKTKGDKILDSPLAKIGEKGLFIKEIEDALLRKEIDLAVHSLKDLPADLPGGLILGAVLKRDEVRDALISKNGKRLIELREEDTIATSSLRRKAQILNYNCNLALVDIRGNIDTRLNKMQEGHCTALVLAACGLERAGLREKITEYLDPEIMLPAAGQGIIGIEIRKDDELSEIVNRINHEATYRSAIAERAFLRKLEGGCQVPSGCLTAVRDRSCAITGLIADLEGKTVIRKKITGPLEDFTMLAEKLAEAILREGGATILAAIRDGNK